MAYNQLIRRTQEWLRHQIRRDSGPWRILVALKLAGTRVSTNLNRRSWHRAEMTFNRLLKTHAQRTPGFFFVQIGAHNGDMDDPVHRWAEEYQWRGLLVEPQPGPFAQLKAGYEAQAGRLIFENVAIDHSERTRLLYKVDPRWASTPEQTGLASFFPDRALATYAAMNLLVSEPVQCLPMARLLDRHQVTRIDLLQIDTEGFDFEIIKMIDFGRIAPAIVHFEHRHLSNKEYSACRQLLRANGYWIAHKEFDAAAFHSAHFPR